MTVNGLDHVNIRTHDLVATAGFFAEVLGLRSGAPAPGLDPARIIWMYDGQGRALLHLTEPGAILGDDGSLGIARSTGAVHHVAFDCSGHAATLARLAAFGIAHRCAAPSPALRQVFVTDPNGVLIELNFRAD